MANVTTRSVSTNKVIQSRYQFVARTIPLAPEQDAALVAVTAILTETAAQLVTTVQSVPGFEIGRMIATLDKLAEVDVTARQAIELAGLASHGPAPKQ